MDNNITATVSAFPRVRDLLKSSWSIYKARIETFLLLTLFGFVFSLITTIVHGWAVGLLLIISTFIYVIVEIGIYKNLSYENDIGFTQSIKLSLKYFLKYVWTFLLLSMIIFGGFVLLIVPAFVWMVALGFALPIIVVEDKWGMDALVQSRSYVRGRGWRVANSYLWFGLIIGSLSIIPNIILHFLPPNQVLTTAIHYLPTFVSLPLAAAYTFNLYKYLKESSQNVEVKSKKLLFASAILGVFATLGIVVGLLYVTYKFLPVIEQKALQEQIKNHPQ
jgi:hypothetical protein